MDIVIPFVDCSKKNWIKGLLDQEFFYLAAYIYPQESIKYGYGHKLDYTYYYDYGTLKYVLRGIDKYMPDVTNIFLIVSDPEQVPDYVDQTKVKVILHKDFIPFMFLPVFSSSVIELFINKIPGLGEEFVYMHDDMIPVSPVSYDELFKDGKPCLNFSMDNLKNLSAYNRCIYRYSYLYARKANYTINGEIANKYIFPEHGPVPLVKSICDTFSSGIVFYSLMNFYKHRKYRIAHSVNICYWCDLLYFSNDYVKSVPRTNNITIDDFENFDVSNLSDNYRYLCINNMKSDIHTTSEIKQIVDNKLNSILPNKCIYERV